jgi:hypothetical protein
VLDRLVRGGEDRSAGRFAGACGRYFFRLVRLALLSGLLYLGIYALNRWLFERLEQWTRDAANESTVLAWSLAAYLLTALLLTLVQMSFDYAKIGTVAEDRRGMLLAALRGVGFVLYRPVKTFGVYYALLAASALTIALYALVAPGAGQTTAVGVVLAFAVGQAFIVVKLVLRLTRLGAQAAVYRDAGRRTVP